MTSGYPSARNAANYFLNNGINRVDTMRLTGNKELRLYLTRGEYFLSMVNPVSGHVLDLLKKVNGEYAFVIPALNQENWRSIKYWNSCRAIRHPCRRRASICWRTISY